MVGCYGWLLWAAPWIRTYLQRGVERDGAAAQHRNEEEGEQEPDLDHPDVECHAGAPCRHHRQRAERVPELGAATTARGADHATHATAAPALEDEGHAERLQWMVAVGGGGRRAAGGGGGGGGGGVTWWTLNDADAVAGPRGSGRAAGQCTWRDGPVCCPCSKRLTRGGARGSWTRTSRRTRSRGSRHRQPRRGRPPRRAAGGAP